MIWASSKAGIRHLVFCGIVNPGDIPAGIRFMESKLQIEKLIRESGLSHTFLRSAPYMDNLKTDQISHGIAGNHPALYHIPYTAIDEMGRTTLLKAGDPSRYCACTINVVSDICSGSDIEVMRTFLQDTGSPITGRNNYNLFDLNCSNLMLIFE